MQRYSRGGGGTGPGMSGSPGDPWLWQTSMLLREHLVPLSPNEEIDLPAIFCWGP